MPVSPGSPNWLRHTHFAQCRLAYGGRLQQRKLADQTIHIMYAPRIDLSVCWLQVNEAMSAWRIRFAPPGFIIDLVMARMPAR
ncbi:hypothetical protein ATE62_01525 [Sphingopyxis sp. HIX]|nr:hypothetical protein ATE61_04720 [Sphingopyxis sp. H057]KTE45641.1 hypothetical protein ATE62_01525 [Sphingopyxis sp. HIX]KTE67979.1 hypothetical protein ATE65_00875 [Sphingopyxis sp. H100]KTE74188.1 hypothetical protein ATE60_02305 [Sphingopyxis sp. H081]